MKKIFGVVILMLLAGCSEKVQVYTDYDQDFDLRQFDTFQWASVVDLEQRNNPLYYNELNDKRIKKLVNDQLTIKGFAQVNQNAGVEVHYHLIIENKTAVLPEPYGMYSPYWTRSGMNVTQYQEGTLIIDVMDKKTKSLAWRGWATSVIDETTGEMNESRLMQAIVKIFEKFPTSAAPPLDLNDEL